MSSAVSHRRRKRRMDGAEEDNSPPRQRRRLVGPSRFPAVRSFCLRLALATVPHRRRKRRPVDALHPGSTPRRRLRRSRSKVVVPYQFAALRPFVLRYILAGAASPVCRRRKASIDMGNYVSRLIRKSTRGSGLEVYKGWVKGSVEVEDLSEPNKVELHKVNAARRDIGDASEAILQVAPPYYEEALESTGKHDGRLDLEKMKFELKLQEGKLAKLPKAPADRLKEDLPELFAPLTNEEENEVNNLLYGSGDSKKVLVVHEPSNIEITEEKLCCLRPHGWLNDEVINLYLELLKERAEREPQRFLRCHFFNTFFYKKLASGETGYDYQSVKRWTTLKKLGYGLAECEKIFVPVHRDMHWCLAVINMKDRTLQFLDSLGGMDCTVLRILARYVMDELEDKSNIEIDTSSWLTVSDPLPLQQNGWDCGMFMLKFIDFHSRGLGLSFSQEHMEYFRKRTAKEIMRLRAD